MRLPSAATTGSGSWSDPIHFGYGITDGCIESHIRVVGPVVHLPLQDASHTIVERLQSGGERGHKLFDQCYGKQVAPLGHIRFIIHVLLKNTPDCSSAGAQFLGDFPHTFARVLLDKITNVSDDHGRSRGVSSLLTTLAFLHEIAHVVWGLCNFIDHTFNSI